MKTLNKLTGLVFILFFSSTAFSQQNNKTTRPNEDIKVNKEYDEHGNLIRYDSTYVYTWSSDSSLHALPDSAFFKHPNMEMMKKQMQRFFGQDGIQGEDIQHNSFFEEFFSPGFFDPGFFDRDVFSKSPNQENFFKDFDQMMEQHIKFRDEHMKQMHKHMDSLRHQFMERQQKYFQQRDSVIRKNNSLNNTISM